MTSNRYVFAGAVFAIGLAATACGGNSGTTATVTQTVSASSSAATTTAASRTTSASSSAESSSSAAASGDVKSLIPTPANTSRTDGPDSIHDGGTHLHFAVNGAPNDVMNAYKTALEGQGWQVTVERSGGGGGGGGATYTGTHGDAFGVFTGGGYGSNTDINSCAWPSKPSNTKCGEDN